MIKKVLALILAGILLIPVLASCNNGKQSGQDTSDSISIEVTDAVLLQLNFKNVAYIG